MEVSCPNCSSKFNLPDKLAKPGAKLRCAVCKNVFQLPGGEQASAAQAKPAAKPKAAAKSERKRSALPEMAPPQKGKLKIWLIMAFLAAALAGGGTWFWMQMDEKRGGDTVAPNVEMLTMRNVRQYNVPNEKLGKVFVIEGRVVNEFSEPKELIELEGAIYDKNKKPLAVKRQLAGTQLSLFQLQVLSEKEMESFLNNRVELLANNTNVPPGGEAPFMILFYNPPDNVAEFGVKIVDVKDMPRN